MLPLRNGSFNTFPLHMSKMNEEWKHHLPALLVHSNYSHHTLHVSPKSPPTIIWHRCFCHFLYEKAFTAHNSSMHGPNLFPKPNGNVSTELMPKEKIHHLNWCGKARASHVPLFSPPVLKATIVLYKLNLCKINIY